MAAYGETVLPENDGVPANSATVIVRTTKKHRLVFYIKCGASCLKKQWVFKLGDPSLYIIFIDISRD